MSESGLTIEGWDEFTKNFSQLVDKWDEKKAELLKRMGNIYLAEIIPNVPVDTSRLVDSIYVITDGIPHDYVEVGTNVEYALYVNDGHVQHKRFLPVSRLSAGGRSKYIKNDGKGIMLSERYVAGTYFMEKGLNSAKTRFERLVDSFMKSCLREIEGGK